MAWAAVALVAGGCSTSKEATRPRFPSPPVEGGRTGEAEKAPSPETTFGYLAQNENCRCEEYTAADKKFPVRYRFKATYRMESGFITRVRITFENGSRDTMFLNPGTVMVSSKNINYQYNNKFLPLPDLVVPPGHSEDLDLDGKEVTASPTWKKIAGEQMTLTLKGMRLGDNMLGTQVVTFVPENPMLKETDQ